MSIPPPFLVIKWSGSEYPIEDGEVTETDTVGDLKGVIHRKTGVKPEHQKLLGLKLKTGKSLSEDSVMADLLIKPNTKIMMMGSKSEEIDEVSKQPEGMPDVLNDLDIPDDEEVPLENRDEYLAKIEKRVKEIKVEVLNPPRVGKKCLVLDIDYTLFDHRSVAENAFQLMRPFLHEFLASAYEDYDIVIWSATGMKWIQVKMRELGVTIHPDYKISFMLDSSSVIWGKFPNHYNSRNTVMFDDIRRNFLMNPQNGLKIKPFREASKNRTKDKELLKLSRYLKAISKLPDLSVLDHKHWQSFLNSNPDFDFL